MKRKASILIETLISLSIFAIILVELNQFDLNHIIKLNKKEKQLNNISYFIMLKDKIEAKRDKKIKNKEFKDYFSLPEYYKYNNKKFSYELKYIKKINYENVNIYMYEQLFTHNNLTIGIPRFFLSPK